MATSSPQVFDRNALTDAGPLLGVWTALLTATFLGVVALLSGSVAGLVARLPLYVLGGAVTFVGVLLVLDHARTHGRVVLGHALAAAGGGFVLYSLATEGVLYALTSPGDVVASHLFVYLLSAALVAAGLWYWSVRNWNDVDGLLGASGL